MTKLAHAWTRRVTSDEPIVRASHERVAVSADFTAYLIRADGKLLAKKYYKGTRLGRPCISPSLTAFPAENFVFLFENKRGKPSGVIPTGTKGIDCAFKEDRLALLTPKSVLFYEHDGEKFVRSGKKRIKGEGLSLDWRNELVVGTTEGIHIGKKFLPVGRVDLVRDGPLLATSVPGGLAVFDGTEELWRKEGIEVTGLSWLGDVLAVGDRSKKRVVTFTAEGEELEEFKFPGAVRSFDWDVVMVVAQRRKVMAFILLPTSDEPSQ
ncbi:hypothetical protein IPA_07145 [Ignicoccus pacificus DSM 13166]|uniref:Uncharacterized protein n=1 Tax=Ignicoccus pacificus DSM 13166 TaxID=940294 RepID=A0A977KCK8_9CREN|nr:hypothetical protein IPA_07145 [Ignicoccus pacificus DSM 13166]